MSSPIRFGNSEAVEEEEMTVKLKSGLVMDQKIYDQLMAYIRAIDYENSGLGHVDMIDGVFVLKYINLPEQEGSGGGTELDAEAVSKMMTSMIKQGKRDALNFWWHSHVKMSPFWSSIDDNNCDRLCPVDGFLISVVGVQSGQMRCRLDVSKPYRMTVDGMPIYINQPSKKKDTDRYTREVARKVRKSQPVTYQYGQQGHQYYPTTHYTPPELSKFRAPIVPKPAYMRTTSGLVVPIDSAFDGELLNIKDREEHKIFQHVLNCHVHTTGIDCMDCFLMDCDMCTSNRPKTSGHVSIPYNGEHMYGGYND